MRVSFGVLVIVASVTAAPAALAYDSVPQRMWFEDTAPVFDRLAFDTGMLPGSPSPVSVRFHITPVGGVVTDLEVESELSWPDILTHKIVGLPNRGYFALDTSVTIGAEVGIDIFGLYQSTVPLWSEGFSIARSQTFTPPLLAGSPDAPLTIAVQNQNLVSPFIYNISVIPGVLGFILEVQTYPELSASVSGEAIETDAGGGVSTQTQDQVPTLLALPTQYTPGAIDLVTTYIANVASSFDVVISPSLSVDAGLFGTYQLVNFPITVPLLSNNELRVFDPVAYRHPLPALGEVSVLNDVGDVLVGQLGNLYVPFPNVGEMGLEATVEITGSSKFQVFPEFLYASPGQTDGVVVTFSPDAVGFEQAMLVLRTSDPFVPELIIPLSGTGWQPEPPDTVPTDGPIGSINGEDLKGGCGCAAIGRGPAVGWLAFGALLLGVARRRR